MLYYQKKHIVNASIQKGKKLKKLIYYISGHGYGHATRSIEVIKKLIAADPHLFVHIRTDAPGWFFKLNLTKNYEVHRCKIDVGAVQRTSFFVDKQATLQQLERLLKEQNKLVEREVDFAGQVKAQLIVADVPFLAFEIAHRLHVPGIAIANFSWDWIYDSFVDVLPGFSQPIERIRSAYRKADLLLRLPMHGDLDVFPHSKDIPLIARGAVRTKEDVRRALGIRPTDKHLLALVAFRAEDLANVDLTPLNRSESVRYVTLGLANAPAPCLNISPDFMYFPDLVNACDVVISKPGYSLNSEIIANRTPLLYTPRPDFVECDVLIQGLERFAVAQALDREAFLAGSWEVPLMALTSPARVQSWPDVEMGGAATAAAEILQWAT